MTKKERTQLKTAIGHFLSDNPDEWTNGIDILCLVVYGEKWSKDFVGKTVSIYDLLKEAPDAD